MRSRAPMSWAALLGLIALGCAPRHVPSQLPPHSPASLEARPGKPADVTAALEEHPPLPGQPADRWPGLSQAPAAAAGHHHHHHHDPNAAGPSPAGEAP